MESSLLLLLSLLRATTAVPGGAAKPILVLAADDPALLLAEIAPPAFVAAVSAALREITQGRMRVEQAIPDLYSLAAQLDQVIAREPQAADRLQALGQQLQILDTINRAAADEHSALTHVSIHLADSELTSLVREWHIAATPTEPAIIVVGTLSGLSGEHGLRLRGSNYIERRVTLYYHTTHAHPRLRLRSLSANGLDDRQQPHHDWWQHPLTDYDLMIFTEQERFKGRILTRQIPLPLKVHGGMFTLTLAGSNNAHIIATEFRDEFDTPLARVLRWPPIEPVVPPT
jgi:hypothetical protein